ncbi:hypothetical protein Tco_1117323 [Tanacetum coccineum]
MSNQSEDIQAAGSDTRPPMLDKTDFESWKQRIRDNIASGTDGPYLGPERDRGLPRDIYKLINHNTDAKDIWDNVKMLLEGSKLTKDDRESQLYDEFEHFLQHKGENIHDYYVRFTKLINDMRHIKMTMPKIQLNTKFVNNMLPEWGRFVTAVKLNIVFKVSPYQYPSSSSVPPQPSHISPVTYQPQFADNTPLNTGLSPANELLDSLTKQGLWFRMFRGDRIGFKETMLGVLLLQEMRELRTELPKRPQNSDYFKEKMLLMQAQENGVDLDKEQLLFLTADQCDAFESDVDEAPTAQTLFMANLSSVDPVYDEVGPSYDSDTLSEVQDHDNCLDNMNQGCQDRDPI